MPHSWHGITPGGHQPKEFNSVIGIPLGSGFKYELDKRTGLIRLGYRLYSAVYYPANYGFIPQMLAEDGDPLDILVLAQEPVAPLTVMRAPATGLMTMMDAGNKDHKIIAIATGDPAFNPYHQVGELPLHRLFVLRRFFTGLQKTGARRGNRARRNARFICPPDRFCYNFGTSPNRCSGSAETGKSAASVTEDEKKGRPLL
jgi:inorganic pyrophosphatase